MHSDIQTIYAHWEAAISDYSKAIALVPTIPDASNERAQIYDSLKNLTEATADLAMAEPLFEHDWEIWRAAACIFSHSLFADDPADDDYDLYGPEHDDW